MTPPPPDAAAVPVAPARAHPEPETNVLRWRMRPARDADRLRGMPAERTQQPRGTQPPELTSIAESSKARRDWLAKYEYLVEYLVVANLCRAPSLFRNVPIQT